MSRSYTSRPAVTNARGRGRGTQTPQTRNTPATGQPNNDRQRVPGVQGRGTTGIQGRGAPGIQGREAPGVQGRGVPNQQQSTTTPPAEQRMTHQGAYTVITPDEKKRQQVAENFLGGGGAFDSSYYGNDIGDIGIVARKEQDAYASYKEKNTQKTFSYVGTVGGGQVTQGAARQQIVNNSPTKAGKLIEKEGRKSFMKQKEEEEIQKKRDAQRLKARQNEARHHKDQDRWDEQKRVTNEAFLRRLENKSKSTEQAAVTNTNKDTTQTNPVLPKSNIHPLNPYRTPIGQSDVEATPTGGGAEGGPDEYATSSTSTSSHGLTAEEEKRLKALAMIFPDIDRPVLIEILQQVGFSVDSAITLLQG